VELPDACTDHTARPCDANALGRGGGGVGDEVQDELCEDVVEGVRVEGQGLGAADPDRDTRVASPGCTPIASRNAAARGRE
jgi:hypothetical protein